MFAQLGTTTNQTRLTTASYWNPMQKDSWFPTSGSPHGFESPAGSSAICIVGGVEKRQVGLRCGIKRIVEAQAPIRREEASERSKSSMLG